MRVSPIALRVALVFLSLALALFFSLRLADLAGTRVIASGRAPNGIEFFVVQRFNWDLGEPFTTGFYYHTTNDTWGWCYYSHQDGLWLRGDARAEFDESAKRVTVFRQGRPDIFFNWQTQFYQHGSRSNLASQSLQPGTTPPDWWSPGLVKE